MNHDRDTGASGPLGCEAPQPNMCVEGLERIAVSRSVMTPVHNTNRSLVALPGGGAAFVPVQYPPFSTEAKELFRRAAHAVGLPLEWADAEGLHRVLEKESEGWVGRPNYRYGARAKNKALWVEVHEELRKGVKTAKSSATGIGQLILDNVRAYYPSGVAGIGNADDEAAGMLRYIKARHKTPAQAWAKWGKGREGY